MKKISPDQDLNTLDHLRIHAPRRSQSEHLMDGFTLLELLVVIAVVALLAALLFPVLGGALGAKDRGVAISNLRQWGLAMNQYLGEHNNMIPAAVQVHNQDVVYLSHVHQITNDKIVGDPPLFAYLYPYINPDWTSLTGTDSPMKLKIAQDPAAVRQGAAGLDRFFMRTLPRADWVGRGPFRPSDGQPVSLLVLPELLNTPLSRIPLLSGIDRQNQNWVGSPEKAPHNGHRAYLFYDGHTEMIRIPDDATVGTEIIPNFRN